MVKPCVSGPGKAVRPMSLALTRSDLCLSVEAATVLYPSVWVCWNFCLAAGAAVVQCQALMAAWIAWQPVMPVTCACQSWPLASCAWHCEAVEPVSGWLALSAAAELMELAPEAKIFPTGIRDDTVW